VLVVGLAPAAHGGNRTGLMFTGDVSGLWLMRAMLGAGFASLPTSERRDDGLRLVDAYVTATGRCAPPDNKPTPGELANCRPFLVRELALLDRLRVVVVLGKIAHDGFLAALAARGDAVPSPRPRFAHAAEHRLPNGLLLLCSYHPSQQNTFTGRLTRQMLDAVFARAADVAASASPVGRCARQRR
jgi:uracil-DNA glycosylase family 4